MKYNVVDGHPKVVDVRLAAKDMVCVHLFLWTGHGVCARHKVLRFELEQIIFYRNRKFIFNFFCN